MTPKYEILLRQFISQKGDDQILALAEKSESLLTWEFHQYLIDARNCDFGVASSDIISSVEELLIPYFSISVFHKWMDVGDEGEAELLANDWLPYLCNHQIAASWEQSSDGNESSNLRKLNDRMRVVQLKCVSRLFQLSDADEKVEWCEYASFLLSKESSYYLSPSASCKPRNLGEANTYSIWAKTILERRDLSRLPFLCLQKALEFYETKKHPVAWATSRILLGEWFSQYALNNNSARLESKKQYLKALKVFNNSCYPIQWADTHIALGSLYLKLINTCNLAEVQHAIQHFGYALQIFEKATHPERWASIQQSLGDLYFKMPDGSKVINTEHAIRLYTFALDVFTETSYPKDWAVLQNNLCACYVQLSEGHNPTNRRAAIEFGLNALKFHNVSDDPINWSFTQLNLGNAFFCCENFACDHAAIEKAIEHYNNSLSVLNEEDNTYDYAINLKSLGRAYSNRIAGDVAINIEKAIDFFKKASSLLNRDRYPIQWASIMHGLALAYSKRLVGNRSDNIELSIQIQTSILSIRNKKEHPEEWSLTCMNLANCFANRLEGDEQDNIEKAMRLYRQSLQIRSRNAYPQVWAMLQSNIGMLSARTLNSNLEKGCRAAIRRLKLSLTIPEPELHPVFRAKVLFNLAGVYAVKQKKNSRSKRHAIKYYETSYEIFRKHYIPYNLLPASLRLAELYMEVGTITKAYTVLLAGYCAFEDIRKEHFFDISGNFKIEDCWRLYELLVECSLQLNMPERAFEYACASKGRDFADILNSNLPIINKETRENDHLARTWNELQKTWNEMDALIRLVDGINDGIILQNDKVSYDIYVRELQKLIERRSELKNSLILNYPDFAAKVNLAPATLASVQSLAEEYRAIIVEYFNIGERWVAFVISEDSIFCKELPNSANDFLHDDCFKLVTCFGHYLNTAENIELQEMVSTGLYLNFISPICQYVRASANKHILIAPYKNLHKIPLGMAKNPDTGEYFFDQYTYSTVYSSTVAIALHYSLNTRKKEARPPQFNALIIGHDTYKNLKLKNMEAEIEAIRDVIYDSTLLVNSMATPDEVLRIANIVPFQVIHIICHAYIDPQFPELSGLLLNGTLTVEQITYELRFPAQPLIVVSACDSGNSSITFGDEMVGVTQAMLQAGAGVVISSSWPAHDRSTRYLFHSLYEELASNSDDIYTGIKCAIKKVRQSIYKPPYYWAAFQPYGLPKL